MIEGSRRLPTHHVTIRVPWHDQGWNGRICAKPSDNTYCLVLPRIGTTKRDAAEVACANKRFDELQEDARPPCLGERATFMSPFPVTRTISHPYANWSELHSHFDETPFTHDPFSAACVPFRWMIRTNAEGDADQNVRGIRNELQLGYHPDREPVLRDQKGREVKTSWVQERANQLALLDTFFGALKPSESLCFFYAKRTPLSEDPRRVIVGVGRVRSVGKPTEYRTKSKEPPLRCVLWERNVAHTIRDDFSDGFLFPYAELIALAEREPGLRLEEHVAFAPEDLFEHYSYGSELLTHDGAIASLLACHTALERIAKVLPGPWRDVLGWIDRELGKLWQARGPFPGLGAALTAFGLERGNLIAYEIDALWASAPEGKRVSPWALVDEVMKNPARLPSGLGKAIGDTFRKKWAALPAERRALLEILSRIALSNDQALRFYQPTERAGSGISVSDREILENPYVLYEHDRHQDDCIGVDAVDRSLFPDEAIATRYPVPKPSAPHDAIDTRRVRAFVVDTLVRAADQGHSVLPREWVIQRIRERALARACPLDEDSLALVEKAFAPHVVAVPLAGTTRGLQLASFAEARAIIADAVTKRAKARRHQGTYDWDEVVARGLGAELPADREARAIETRARREKAAALAELFASRISVLVGAAGTGKTTLLRILCGLGPVAAGGILLLAPTGKARVRLEEQTRMRGVGKTIAQMLHALKRYDSRTGRYYPNPSAPRSAAHKTVIIDECSMLTEEQLAAVLDALQGVERLVLVGDPQQLPPIGAGRPFLDIVRELSPKDLETRFPRQGSSYAELTVPSRQRGIERDDVALAAHFSGRVLDPGADEVWTRLAQGTATGIRAVQWKDAGELHELLVRELLRVLPEGPDDETRFELSIGGSLYGPSNQVYFWAGRGDGGGAGDKAHEWQILSPVRGAMHGADALNRALQERFRKRALKWATAEPFYLRKVPRPLGPSNVLWGDKVINVINDGGRRTYPKIENPYVANGDIGIVVGEYRTQKFRGIPENLEVEFASQPNVKYTFWASEMMGDERTPPLDLAYALTVHKTQGSEFETTFVIVPTPCRLLSRELLYTALTRHRRDVVLLHQGPLTELRRYTDAGASEIASRMTNLFQPASPREVSTRLGTRFLDERLIHRTERGDLVRSKSEVIIADKMHARNVRYVYEPAVVLDGIERRPDFVIADDDMGTTYYWEHLGMLGDPVYHARWERKLAGYRRAGILPIEEGHGANGTLIVTRDEPNGGVDSGWIARVVEDVLVRGVGMPG